MLPGGHAKPAPWMWCSSCVVVLQLVLVFVHVCMVIASWLLPTSKRFQCAVYIVVVRQGCNVPLVHNVLLRKPAHRIHLECGLPTLHIQPAAGQPDSERDFVLSSN
eukprot:125805-Amphidinium_carterae.2